MITQVSMPARSKWLGRLSKTAGLALALYSFAVPANAPLDIRYALVIGNAAYPGAAKLDNPLNDAAAIAMTLRGLGFEVAELQNAGRLQMANAVDLMTEQLKGKNATAVFYYAGHGMQLNWRNYMVPVDAKLASPSDVPRQTVDLSSVVDSFKKAGNRVNILILDACRDNPFKAASATGKGLAPLDAPAGTFLAFATAPGNVAEDGDIADGNGNGLYTQFLLQELKTPAARIEDVFKRVRFSVRKKSQGRQIPWESTSLEEDFYFNDGVKFTFRPEYLAKVEADMQGKREQRRAQEAQAREREQQLVAEQTKERERQLASAKAVEQQRQADEARLKEIQRLAAEARTKEQNRLTQEIKDREELRIALQAQAKEREKVIALERASAQQAQAARERERAADESRIAEIGRLVARAKALSPTPPVPAAQARELELRTAKSDWGKAKDSADPDVLFDFLAKHPAGTEFAEIAQYRLDQVAKPLVQVALGRGHETSLSYRGPRFRLGDQFQFELVDMLSKTVQRTYWRRVTAIDKDVVQLNEGAIAFTPLGAALADDYGSFDTPFGGQPVEFQIGKKWSSRATQRALDGRRYELTRESKIIALEVITVPAGQFQTYVVEATEYVSSGAVQRRKIWYDPRYGVPIRSEVRQYGSDNSFQRSERRELIAIKADRS